MQFYFWGAGVKEYNGPVYEAITPQGVMDMLNIPTFQFPNSIMIRKNSEFNLKKKKKSSRIFIKSIKIYVP